jgi:hypothetical protein
MDERVLRFRVGVVVVAGFPLNKLAYAAILGPLQFARRAVKDNLRLVRLQPRDREHHDHAVRDFAGRTHVVRDDDTGYRVSVTRAHH